MQRPFAIALVWFLCLGGAGLIFPFYGLYLRENAALSGVELGLVLGVLPLVGIAAQPVWGQVADRTGSRTRVLCAIALGAAAGYAALFWAREFAALLLLTAALAFFSQALVPNTVALTLALARPGHPHEFGRARVWGTIGFLVMVAAFPALLDAYQGLADLEQTSERSFEPGLELIFPLAAGLTLLAGLVSLALPRGGAEALRAPQRDWRRLLRHGPFVRLLIFTLAAYLFLQAPMSQFAIFVSAHGGSIEAVSQMWIFMLLPEIPLVALSGAVLQRIGARGLLAMGVLAGGLRWTVCALAPDLVWIYAVQPLHGVVVAGLLVGGPLYVEAAVPERLRSTGQALLAMVGLGIGGFASQLGGGWLLEYAGPDAPYRVGGLGALALGLLLPVLLPSPSRPRAVRDAADG